MSDLLAVADLRVAFGGDEVVHGISFGLAAGECLAIVGESGSGKSVTARTLVGLAGAGSAVSASRLTLGDEDLRALGDRGWRRVRGAQVGFVLQDALVSLDPLRRVGAEIAEPLRVHGWGGRAPRRDKVIELLADVGVPEPELRAHQLPHELSGGLRQRALIASAIALDPALLIADEPTTALDVTVQAQILELLRGAKRRGRGLIVISHDLAVVASIADRVAVMQHGVIVEQGPVDHVLHHPSQPYTRALLDAVPSARPPRARRPIADGAQPLIAASGLTKRYRGPDGAVRTVVDDVSLEIAPGETLGVVGESGSGKTTTARMVLALVEPDAGEVRLGGEPWSTLAEKDRRPRRRHIAVVYQDPLSSFDPRWNVARVVADAIPAAAARDKAARAARVLELLQRVGLGAEHVGRRPLQLSGGQRQRVAIARALAAEPDVIVCDEPVSALDVSVQAQVLDLLTELQRDLGVAYLFISHDLGVIHHMSDRVVVMKDGRIVESGTADDVFTRPQADYTRRLLAAVPTLDTAADDRLQEALA
jgi:peptide/nickel transport system ATP-binding protein